MVLGLYASELTCIESHVFMAMDSDPTVIHD